MAQVMRAVARRIEGAAPDFVSQLSDDTRKIIDACRPFTMTSVERLEALIEAVRYVDARGIPGAVVECGVWRGGSSMAAMLASGAPGREFYLYDTFDGMSEPTGADRERGSGASAADMLSTADGDDLVWARAGLDEVRRNVASTGYPADLIHYVAGKVEDTIPGVAPPLIAVLRLDTDWYESTKHELAQLYPRLQPGGVLIIDDYGHWDGARKAVDEYFADSPILLNRIDYTGRVAIKA
ncbi:TylF/MycF/NovP-related O-methyltransferase [uncultured Sphingomonas sp.]|uniref:TylF/MycF/NovP-related O-methyltransferase n=1 Tax=uncultured Sphingomonas sp. TaxID=158754 RepID=UPI0035CA9C6E